MAAHRKNDATRTKIEKTLTVFEIKDAAKGEVEACIATLDVVDRDGDIIRPGAIVNGAQVVVSSYGHDAVYGKRPVGKGTIAMRDNKAIFSGRLFLNTTDGRETFEVLKEMGADQEWSFGFCVIGYEVPSEDEKKQGAWRVLTKLDAFEVSPVLIGAGIGTQTLAVKQADGDATPIPPSTAEPTSDATSAAPVVEDPALLTPTGDDPAAKALEVEAQRQASMDAKASDVAAETFQRFQRTMKSLGVFG